MGERKLNKVAFYGPATSGKTWCANYLVDKYGYTKVSFAAKLKQIARDLFNVSGKNGEDRKVLQNIGATMRDIRPNVWIDFLLNQTKTADNNFVLDDLRYTNEATALREDGWTLIIVVAPWDVRRDRQLALYPDTPESAYYHASEQEWSSIDPDYIVRSVDPEETKAELDLILGVK